MSNDLAELALPQDLAFQAALYTHPNPTRRGLHQRRRAWVEQRLSLLVGSESLALEVGVGCGVFVRYLADRAARVHAVDINQAFLDGVAGIRQVHTLNADATRALAIEAVDVALCTEVLEHVPRDRSLPMLQSLRAALKPGGYLVLTTPQRYGTVELVARLFRFPSVLALARRLYGTAEELGHINLLTAGQLRDQLARAGFEMIEQERFGFYIPLVAEFGGRPGWALLSAAEKLLRPVPVLRGLLWTQAYLLRRPASSGASTIAHAI
jgi:SAM-dependent methyltransferase